jgi:hypothetical protein
MTDVELLAEIKRKAKDCIHADQACSLIYFINNFTNADAPWRSWKCEQHHYTGHGAIPNCPKCKSEPIIQHMTSQTKF